MGSVSYFHLTLLSDVTDTPESGCSPSGVSSVEQPEKLSSSVRAAFHETSDGWSLCYKTDEGGVVTTRLQYRAATKTVTLTCSGALSYTVSLRVGTRSMFLYRVPPAAFDAEAEALAVGGHFDTHGGELTLCYRLIIGGVTRLVRLRLSAVPIRA